MKALNADGKTIPIERQNNEECVYEFADDQLHLQ